MTLKVVALPVGDKSAALEVVESLRRAVESGQIKAFACAGIEPDHCTRMWSSCTLPTTRLEMIGAITSLQHCYIAGED
ncbi:hypothetical protein [Bordetella petrii]|uniref:hypothetical protein n=1 Tax=Bordetella petrii TaxID=94624 RepID=UPI00047DAFE5|nr:hypothetical protein [Bordetella petrii]